MNDEVMRKAEFEMAVIELLGPEALNGDGITPMEVAKRFWNAALTQAPIIPEGWIRVETELPPFLNGQDYSANVFGVYTGYQDKQLISVFSRVLVEVTEEGHTWAWARLASHYFGLAECATELKGQL